MSQAQILRLVGGWVSIFQRIESKTAAGMVSTISGGRRMQAKA